MQDTIMRQQNNTPNIRSNEKQLLIQKWIDDSSLIGRRRTNETRRLVRGSFKSTNDVHTEGLHLSLCCPITKRRIKLPCVSSFCEHVACFDGEAFLKINKYRAIWHCPLCNIVFDLEDLRIDSLLRKILNCTTNDCLRVSFDREGEWKEVVEVENRRRSRKSIFNDEIIILDDKEKDFNEKDINVIIILDSDNDDDQIYTSSS